MMIICALGVLQIFSATHDTVWQGSWWKQVAYIAAGILLMWIATSVDYHALMSHVYPLYIASLVLLIAVLVIGKRAFGSTRWIALPLLNSPAGFRVRQDRDCPPRRAFSDRTAKGCAGTPRSAQACCGDSDSDGVDCQGARSGHGADLPPDPRRDRGTLAGDATGGVWLADCFR